MPVIKSAIKKLRQAGKREILNKRRKTKVKDLVDGLRKSPTAKNLSAAYSGLDKAVKTGVLHKNKAARLKSRLSKRLKK